MCSDVEGNLGSEVDFKCRRCKGNARPLDGRRAKTVVVGGDSLEVVHKFCYLIGDVMLQLELVVVWRKVSL